MAPSNPKTLQPVTAISSTAAQISFWSSATFLLLLIVLHFIKPEFDQFWRFISEYAIGDFGWLMVIAFLSLALSYVALFIAIRPQVQTLGGRIGLVLLLISATGLFMAGIFTTDPITADKDSVTTSGMLHSLGGTLGIAMPFATIFISWTLYRNPNWVSMKRSVLGSAILVLVGFLVASISLGVLLTQNNGVFGPEVPVGYPTRFEALTYCVWIMVVTRQAISLKNKN